MTTCTGVLWLQRGFVLKNPVPETLAWHGLRLITGVFGVLFQLLGYFFKKSSRPPGSTSSSGSPGKNIFSDRKKP
jgi:hypothetical protein